MQYAIRSLLRTPGFLLTGMLTLALGVGANTAIFAVVHGALLRPLPYPGAERIAVLTDSGTARAFQEWEGAAQSLAALGAWRNGTFNLTGGGTPQRVQGAIVSGTFFEVFAMPAALGRVIDTTDAPGAGRVGVLGDALWRRSFGADPRVIGSTFTLSGEPVRVVGVMPPAFEFPQAAELWISSRFSVPEHSLSPNVDPLRLQPSSYLWTAGRLRPGVTLQAAAAERRAIAASQQSTPVQQSADAGPALVPLRDWLFGDMRQPLLMLLLCVALVLLLACANLANLLLARASGRRHEMAVRAALGASRGMLVGQVVTEGMLVGAAGGVCGLVAAAWLLPVMLTIAPEGVRFVHAGVGVTASLLALSAAVVSGTLAGLVPALAASRVSHSDGLTDTRRIAGHALGQRARQGLVVVQFALSLALLVGVGLLLRSFVHVVTLDPGFRADGLSTFRIDLPTERYAAPEAQAAFYQQLLDRLRGVPGIAEVAATTRLPFTTGESTRGLATEGGAPPRKGGALFRVISPEYFQVMGVPIVSGRALTAQDNGGGAPVAVVNETLARQLWPSEPAVGRRFRISNEPALIEVVGVARDMKHKDLREQQGAAFFLPYQQAPWSYMTIVMRTGGPAPGAAAIRDAIAGIDREVPMPALRSMRELMAGSVSLERFQLTVTGAFAIVALTLAALGLYGVMSYLVGQRRKEVALRLALGAEPRALIRLVMRDALVMTGVGCATGAVLAGFIARSLQGALFGVGSGDSVTFVAAAALLILVAMVASFIPARRAARVDPAMALRAD